MSGLDSPWGLDLTNTDRNTVTSPTGWYTDNVILAFQRLIQREYQVRLQDPVQGQKGFYYWNDNSIQIVHVNGNHWVVVAFDKTNNTVCVYDSNGYPGPSASTARPSAELSHRCFELFRCNNIVYMPCQQQTNGNDCGPLSVANMEHLVRGVDPSSVIYPNPSKLREQLMRMLMRNKAHPFSSIRR